MENNSHGWITIKGTGSWAKCWIEANNYRVSDCKTCFNGCQISLGVRQSWRICLSACLAISLHGCLSISLSAYMPVCLFNVHLSVCLSNLYLYVCLSISQHVCLSLCVCLFNAYLSVCLSLCMFVYLYACLSIAVVCVSVTLYVLANCNPEVTLRCSMILPWNHN